MASNPLLEWSEEADSHAVTLDAPVPERDHDHDAERDQGDQQARLADGQANGVRRRRLPIEVDHAVVGRVDILPGDDGRRDDVPINVNGRIKRRLPGRTAPSVNLVDALTYTAAAFTF